MKHIKKLASLLLAVVMILALATTAFATDHSISTDSTTHTYEIYQIFRGTVSDGQLTSLVYGKNAKTGTEGSHVSATDIAALGNISDAGNTGAADQADIAAITPFVNLNSTPIATIGKGHDSSASLPEGYYLIKDKDNSLSGTEQYTLYLVKLLNDNLTIAPKAGTTTSEKKVDDVNDSDTTATADNGKNQDSADYDIGDNVPFHLTAHLAGNVSSYKKYHLTFTDTLESGKFDAISALSYTIAGASVSSFPYIDPTNGFKVTQTINTQPTKDGFKITLTFEPTGSNTTLPAYLDSKDVKIDFTARLGAGANIGNQGNTNTLSLKYSNNPNSSADSDEGTAPDDTVIVFTYKVVVNKVDANSQPLGGADFTLYKKIDGSWVEVTGKKTTNADTDVPATTFTFTGLDDGEYKLVESKVPDNYNKADDIEFKIVANHVTPTDVTDRTMVLTSLSGNVTSGSVTFTPSLADGSLTTSVVNQSGATLPAAGGIGTTIFYVTGAVLALGAGILLITKRRMNR